MVKVKFTENSKTGMFSLKVNGHAGQAEIGKDIVCASASILAYTVAQIVTNMKSLGCLKKAPTVKMGKGDAVVTCHPKEEYMSEVEQTYLVVQTGYELLAHNYPQYVELTKFGKAKA